MLPVVLVPFVDEPYPQYAAGLSNADIESAHLPPA
jgi:hypothetical protein